MKPTTSTLATSGDCGRARRNTRNGDNGSHDRASLSARLPAAICGFSDLDRWRGAYSGSKGGAGVWQTIINQIPPHKVWIEAFAGSGQVTRHKEPASATMAAMPRRGRLSRSSISWGGF